MDGERFDRLAKAAAARTSRRAVVRAGAKLAYAAPAVAASLSLTAPRAAAVSGGPAADACVPLDADCTGLSSAACCGDLACRRVPGGGGQRTCRPADNGACIAEGGDCTGLSSAACCGGLACRRVVGGGGSRTCRP